MASISLGAVSFLIPPSLHPGTPTQQQHNPHHQMLQVNERKNNSNMTFSFSNPSSKQGIHILEEDDVGESKLEIIEESQEETSPKETDCKTTIITNSVPGEIKQNILNINESKYKSGNRMRSCLMDDNMSSKEAVESLLLLGREAVVANDDLDLQTGVCSIYYDYYSLI